MFYHYLFYTIGIILPTILILFSLGNIVFVTSEFKGIANVVPKILIYLLFKILTSTFLLIGIYHLVFLINNDLEIGHRFWLMLICGSYIIIESVIVNKMVSHSDKLVSHSSELNQNSTIFKEAFMNKWTKIGWKSIISCNYMFYVITICLLILGIIYSSYITIEKYNIINLSFTIIISLNILTKYMIIKHVKNL